MTFICPEEFPNINPTYIKVPFTDDIVYMGC